MARKRIPLKKRIRRLEVRLQRNPRMQAILRGTVSGYLRLVKRTTRWQYLGVYDYTLDAYPDAAIFCGWHGRLAGIPFIANKAERPILALASDHPDGLLIVEMLRGMGHESILLSTSGDNTQPLREALRALRRGRSLGIATDGPLGPALQSKPGAVTLASLSGKGLVPVGYAAWPCVRLKTWDRFVLPLPFGRGVLSAGEPIPVKRRLSVEETDAVCTQLNTAINAETARCEAALGRN